MKSMIGLLAGAVADMRLRELEAAFLDTWLRDNHHLSGEHDAREVKLTRMDTYVASLR
ncbi:MAG: hypothetical protein RI563_13150 [Thiohalophilus sp.]|uniref:hypothetical protein n=1 Tax=Thiohalophilus sp. TaxID=3028392 RepID=UPI0028705128|nr:hypothetical protein [Thiohalophilus sp.]MDR9437823.1 hypothetical protein [Thiohalophilus sp.]